MRQWQFVADMNGDGLITISDVGLWFKWLYFWPGDAVIYALMETPLGRFFEVSPASYSGAASGIISLFVWTGWPWLFVLAERFKRTELGQWLNKGSNERYDKWIWLGILVISFFVMLCTHLASHGWSLRSFRRGFLQLPDTDLVHLAPAV